MTKASSVSHFQYLIFLHRGHGYADLKANVFNFENRSSALKIQKRIDPNT